VAIIIFDRDCEACQQGAPDISPEIHLWIHAVLTDKRDVERAGGKHPKRAADGSSEDDAEKIHAALNRLEDAIEDIRFTLDNAGKD
jgi:hypothetical protein